MVLPAGKRARLSRRTIVIGGSIAGLFVAALLRRIGWQVDIYERSSVELIGRGVGIFASIWSCLFRSPSLMFGRVALVGDAGSTPRPHVGFGVSKAGAEAQALAAALADHDDIDRALAAYSAVRQPLSERIVSHSRKLGAQLGVGIKTAEDRRLARVLQTPDGILDWIAVPNFLAMRP